MTIVINYIYCQNKTRATLLQNMPITKAFDRDVGIIDMHIRDMLLAISGYFIVFSDIDHANINLNDMCHTCIICVTIQQ
jgi:hypothetical protein